MKLNDFSFALLRDNFIASVLTRMLVVTSSSADSRDSLFDFMFSNSDHNELIDVIASL